ncbi:hypothetical protein HY025_00310 [Candidatus Daviesbacteria bacterium]|nr:hypothetical protein [Candidatus Daviesbacteria bacterium]
MNREKLDGIVLDIEFLLISVVQGVALVSLADNSSHIISNLHFEYWLYVLSGLLLILIFWSQAIIHALSFIDWPMDLVHSFLYFLVSLVEIMAFSAMDNPLLWFGFIVGLFVVAAGLYIFDLNLIKKHESVFNTKQKKLLFNHILSRQLFELKFLVPAGFIFNLSAFLLIYFFKDIFLENRFHLTLIFL